MTLILHVVGILLVVVSRPTKALPLDNYQDPNARNQPQFAAYLMQLYNHNNDNNKNHDPLFHQSLTRYYPSTSIPTKASFLNQYEGPLFERRLMPNHNSPWSGAPIFVDYEDYDDREQPDSGRPAIQRAHLPPKTPIRGPPQSLLAQSDSRSAFKTFPTPAPNQQPQSLRYYQHQQQYSSPARNFYTALSQNTQWPSTPISNQFVSHFERYVSKYPRRLQPIYSCSQGHTEN